MPRIKSITFDSKEQPLRATIVISSGTLKVAWKDVCGDRCWFTAGTLQAKKLAVCTIQRNEQMAARL